MINVQATKQGIQCRSGGAQRTDREEKRKSSRSRSSKKSRVRSVEKGIAARVEKNRVGCRELERKRRRELRAGPEVERSGESLSGCESRIRRLRRGKRFLARRCRSCYYNTNLNPRSRPVARSPFSVLLSFQFRFLISLSSPSSQPSLVSVSSLTQAIVDIYDDYKPAAVASVQVPLDMRGPENHRSAHLVRYRASLSSPAPDYQLPAGASLPVPPAPAILVDDLNCLWFSVPCCCWAVEVSWASCLRLCSSMDKVGLP